MPDQASPMSRHSTSGLRQAFTCSSRFVGSHCVTLTGLCMENILRIREWDPDKWQDESYGQVPWEVHMGESECWITQMHWLCIISARQHAERAICYHPSVCPSVTRVDQSKTVERIIEIFSPSDRPNILVFWHLRSLRKSDGFTPNGGAKYKGGSKN